MVAEALSAPAFFQELIRQESLAHSDIHTTDDGFWAAGKSVADILGSRGITTFPNDRDEERRCDKFYDDWYLYAVPGDDGFVYSLFKMREQEFDTEGAEPADGDTPGVTVCFIALKTELLAACLDDPTAANRKAFNRELNRVVAARGQRHHTALKTYFIRPQAQAPYLIARLYTDFIAGLAKDGTIPVPKHYAALYRKDKATRLPRFIDANNDAAGYTVCDHENIHIRDSGALTQEERLAILATHTANVSVHSFAAEILFHARFLVWFAKVLVFPYASAIRADMTICDKEFQGFSPYYRLNSRLVKQQEQYHQDC